MSRVTQKELDSIRDAQEDFLPDRILQTKRKHFDGDNGYQREPWLTTPFDARFVPGYGRWGVVADKFQGITPYTVTVAWDVDILAGDEIVDEMGRTFEVRDVKHPSSYQTAKQLLADMVLDA